MKGVFCSILMMIVMINLVVNAERSFRVDYEHNQFLKDGKPFRYVAGDLAYFKVPSVLWKDRMLKYKAAGLNAIQTYVDWSFHEQEKGVYKFSGDQDLEAFLTLAKQLDLLVIFRPGPFVNAERDLGGLPWWLLSINPQMKLRSSDPTYLAQVDKWFGVLLPKVVKHLYKNGGPIITVQVENEYGCHPSCGKPACETKYTGYMRDLTKKHLGSDVVLFTTDPWPLIKCGQTENTLTTVDFGADVDPAKAFGILRKFSQKGPLVNSEFYPGWIDHWEKPHETRSSQMVCATLDKMLAMNASVNIYPLHGGTQFGFNNGANEENDSPYSPTITSYDFDAPLTEAGDPTPKYFEIRKVIGKYLPLPNLSLPVPEPKMELKNVVLKPVLNIFQKIIDTTSSDFPRTFESLKLGHGFVLYERIIDFNPSDPASLYIPGLADRAQVFVDHKYQGTLSKTNKVFNLPINAKKSQKLQIFVENQGRPNFGPMIGEPKGIIGNVTLENVVLTGKWNQSLFYTNWEAQVSYAEALFRKKLAIQAHSNIPAFYVGEFTLPNDPKLPLDTFLQPTGFKKGSAFLNGFNLGRYWPAGGPQVTLYVPKHLFKKAPAKNTITLFELEGSNCADSTHECSVSFVRVPILNGTTPDAKVNTKQTSDQFINLIHG